MLLLGLLASASADVVRHALIVGSNDGGGELVPLRYAEQDAERFQQVLSELGGFSPERITVLHEPERDELLAALQRHAFIAQEHDEDMFLFYYSGHATARGLKLGEETLPYAELRSSMNDLPSEVRLGVLDACRSGEITRLKGLTLSEPFATDDTLSTEGEAWLTASAANEDAQESDRLQGSFFTHSLISGLRGAADQDDGVVSLSEAYAYAYDQTVSRTGRTDAGAQHPTYDFRIQGEGDLPLTDVRQASARITLPESLAGVLTVLSIPEATPLVEIAKKADVVTVVALPPGRYTVRLKDAQGSQETDIGLSEGANLILPDFTRRPQELATLKGTPGSTQPPEHVLPPPLFDPQAPRITDDPEGALEALLARLSERATYESNRAHTQTVWREPPSMSWPQRRRARNQPAPDIPDPSDADAGAQRHLAGVCTVIGAGCLAAPTSLEQQDGAAFLTYPSGAVAAQGTLIAGIPNGQWTFYYEDGRSHSAGRYSNGVSDGAWVWWYPGGQKRMAGQLHGSARVGTWMEWYDTGKRKSRTEYSNGSLDGRRTEWYPSGQKKSEGKMSGERRHGRWISFYEDGRKKSRGFYSTRGRTGTWTTWDSNGVKASKGSYVDDLRHGSWTFWWEDGSVSAEGRYKHGNKNGRWQAWHPSGAKRSQAHYDDGVLSGSYAEWNAQGEQRARGRYRDGEPVGRWSRWSDEGSRQVERISQQSRSARR